MSITSIALGVMAVAVVGYAAICLFLYLGQARHVYFPKREITATPAARGLPFEDVRLTTSDGVTIHGWFVPARNERAVLLFCHGNGGNLSHRVESLALFNSIGLSTFVFDYRGYGESEGEPSEEGTYRDAEAAWRYLVETRGISPGRIVLFGRSLGGAVASWLAVQHPPPALILESTFTSIPDMARERFPWLPIDLLTRFHYNNIANVRKLRCPILVVHSPEDETIPYTHGEAIFAAAHEPKEFLEIRFGHNDGYVLTGRAYLDRIERFLSNCEF